MSSLPISSQGAVTSPDAHGLMNPPQTQHAALPAPVVQPEIALTGKETLAKARYRSLCESETSIPIFSRAWWLDAVAGQDNWEVALVEKKGVVLATMPYCLVRKWGFSLIVHPPLTQTMGPWIRYMDSCQMKRLSEDKKLMSELIAQLPPHDYFEQRWHYSKMNWLPFYWAGFQQTTRYTYVINDISDPEALFIKFASGKRQDIKKARRALTVRLHLSADEFYDHHVKTLRQRNSTILYSRDIFKRLYSEGYRRDAAFTLGAYDKQGTLHAALFIIWDEYSAYGLINSIDQSLKASGAGTLLLCESLKYVSGKTRKFDFEGSMIPAVEASIRQFNSIQTPYFSVMKTSSRLYGFLKHLKSLKR